MRRVESEEAAFGVASKYNELTIFFAPIVTFSGPTNLPKEGLRTPFLQINSEMESLFGFFKVISAFSSSVMDLILITPPSSALVK